MRITSLMLLGGVVFLSTAMAASAADVQADVVSGPHDWTGAFVGGHVSHTWGDSDTDYVGGPLSVFADDPDTDPSGFSGGVQGGYNWQTGSGIVFGIEGSVDFGDVSDTIDDPNPFVLPGSDYTITAKSDVSGMVLGRLGYAVGDFLPYLAGGVAVSRTEVSFDNPAATNNSDTKTLVGGAFGAGLEYAVTEKLSIGGEALYTKFSDENFFEGETYETSTSASATTVRLQLNFHF